MADKFSVDGSDVVMSRPLPGTNEIPPGFYYVTQPPFQPPRIVHATGNDSLEQTTKDSASWNFEGSEAHGRVIKDVQLFFDKSAHPHYKGVPRRRGVILFGPPGTGKSIIARSAAMQAVSLGVPVVFASTVPSVKICGQTGHKMLIVVDEIDEVSQDGGLSQAIDSLGSSVFVIGTTNYMRNLDNRLTNRPGRFDRLYKIDRMTLAMVTAICEKKGIAHLSKEIHEKFATVTPSQINEIALRAKLYGDANPVADVLAEFGQGKNDNE